MSAFRTLLPVLVAGACLVALPRLREPYTGDIAAMRMRLVVLDGAIRSMAPENPESVRRMRDSAMRVIALVAGLDSVLPDKADALAVVRGVLAVQRGDSLSLVRLAPTMTPASAAAAPLPVASLDVELLGRWDRMQHAVQQLAGSLSPAKMPGFVLVHKIVADTARSDRVHVALTMHVLARAGGAPVGGGQPAVVQLGAAPAAMPTGSAGGVPALGAPVPAVLPPSGRVP